jgi:hypothetical protein
MKSTLQNATAAAFYDFMVNAPQDTYAHWLPGEHHEFHIFKRGKNTPVDDLIFFDQHISPNHRLTFYAITSVAEKSNRILFQMRKFGINLPGYLELQFDDTSEGLLLTETIRIGFGGYGKIFDPAIRLVFNKSFFTAMNSHHKREWECLGDILRNDGD